MLAFCFPLSVYLIFHSLKNSIPKAINPPTIIFLSVSFVVLLDAVIISKTSERTFFTNNQYYGVI